MDTRQSFLTFLCNSFYLRVASQRGASHRNAQQSPQGSSHSFYLRNSAHRLASPRTAPPRIAPHRTATQSPHGSPRLPASDPSLVILTSSGSSVRN